MGEVAMSELLSAPGATTAARGGECTVIFVGALRTQGCPAACLPVHRQSGWQNHVAWSESHPILPYRLLSLFSLLATGDWRLLETGRCFMRLGRVFCRRPAASSSSRDLRHACACCIA